MRPSRPITWRKRIVFSIRFFAAHEPRHQHEDVAAEGPGPTGQCLLLLDELAAIGRVGIGILTKADMAGYNLRLLPILQSVAQLALRGVLHQVASEHPKN